MRIVTFGDDTAKFISEAATTDEQSLKDFANGVLEGKIEVDKALEAATVHFIKEASRPILMIYLCFYTLC